LGMLLRLRVPRSLEKEAVMNNKLYKTMAHTVAVFCQERLQQESSISSKHNCTTLEVVAKAMAKHGVHGKRINWSKF
jgi:hypothetical protein